MTQHLSKPSTKLLTKSLFRSLSKKAQFDFTRKTIYLMIAGFIITVVVIAYVFVIAGYNAKLTYVDPKLRAEILTLRFANNPECFAYQHPDTKITTPGTIDLVKFTPPQLYNCYHTEKTEGFRDFNFKLVLEHQQTEIMTNNYFNKNDFTLYKEVLVRTTDGKIIKDRLIIYVQEKI